MLDHVLSHLCLPEMLGFALILLGSMDAKTGFAPEAPPMQLLLLTKTVSMRQGNNRQLCNVCTFPLHKTFKGQFIRA